MNEQHTCKPDEYGYCETCEKYCCNHISGVTKEAREIVKQLDCPICMKQKGLDIDYKLV